VRNNILIAGGGTTAYGVYEENVGGASAEPSVFENNVLSGGGIAWREWVIGSSAQALHTTMANADANWQGAGTVQNNLDANCALDGTYHLTTGSPCIDQGVATEAPATDIDGDDRPLAAGGVGDLGADEHQ
jgi:hypothetical protein